MAKYIFVFFFALKFRKTKEKFGERIEKLESQMSGPYHEVVSRICRSILDKRITVPGNFNTFVFIYKINFCGAQT